ncbi:hypothetical protein ACH5RR_003080 [Cinchona calisaya]|uniref:Uncharacterized protein n=1 Tax=Cinchona calisaya TaxID=153742 RepID=A0ABD3AUD4_9GENT
MQSKSHPFDVGECSDVCEQATKLTQLGWVRFDTVPQLGISSVVFVFYANDNGRIDRFVMVKGVPISYSRAHISTLLVPQLLSIMSMGNTWMPGPLIILLLLFMCSEPVKWEMTDDKRLPARWDPNAGVTTTDVTDDEAIDVI